MAPTSPKTSNSLLPIVFAFATVIAVLGAIALIAIDMLEAARGRAIENAPNPNWLITLVSGIVLIAAIAWGWWLMRNRGKSAALTKIALAIAAIALIAMPLAAWQALSSARELTITTMICPLQAENANPASAEDCRDEAVDTIVLLEGKKSDEVWVPDATTGNLTREFKDLPAGNWSARITVDGPPETASVTVVAEKDGADIKLGALRPSLDQESGRLRWSAAVPIDVGISNVRVQFHASSNPAVDSAQIRFDVLECPGQVVRNFDASQCSPLAVTTSLVSENEPKGERTWRQPLVTYEGSTMVVKNLEARSYSLRPNYPFIEANTNSTDVLIIPSAMPQDAANTISQPGESAFDVEIEANSGALEYKIYIFPSGPTYAFGPQLVA